MQGPLDPLSWDEMLDDLGYSDDDEEDAYYSNKKNSKNKKKTKFRDYEWDDYE
jgi:hypothetical protein